MSSIPRLITALLVAVSSGLAFSGHLAAAGSQVPGLSGTLVITNKTSSTATLIDVAAGRILSTLPTGQGPHEVVLTSDGGTAVITNYGGSERKTLTVIDLPTRAVKRTIDLESSARRTGSSCCPATGSPPSPSKRAGVCSSSIFRTGS